jgi:hypothetical protein
MSEQAWGRLYWQHHARSQVRQFKIALIQYQTYPMIWLRLSTAAFMM